MALGTMLKLGLRHRVKCLAHTVRSEQSADVMGFGFGLVVSLSLTGWGTHVVSTGVDPGGGALLLAVGLGLLGFSSRGLWTAWTAACRSMAVTTR